MYQLNLTKSEACDLERLLNHDWYKLLDDPRLRSLRVKLSDLFDDAGLYDHDATGADDGHPSNFGDF